MDVSELLREPAARRAACEHAELAGHVSLIVVTAGGRHLGIQDVADAARMFDLLMGNEAAPRREFIVGGAAELDPSRIDT